MLSFATADLCSECSQGASEVETSGSFGEDSGSRSKDSHLDAIKYSKSSPNYRELDGKHIKCLKTVFLISPLKQYLICFLDPSLINIYMDILMQSC